MVEIIHQQSEELPGTFGNQVIKTELFTVSKNPNLVVNIPSPTETLKGLNDKYQRFASSLQQQGASNVLLIEPSSLESRSDQRMVTGKTFEQEVEDARRAITHYTNQAEALMGINPPGLKLLIQGNSFGGMVALLLAGELRQTSGLSIVGMGVEPTHPADIQLSGFPNADFAKILSDRSTQKTVIQFGSADEIYSRQSFFDLLKMLGSKEKDIAELRGVDHTFTQLNGEDSKQPFAQVERNVTSLLEGTVPGGIVNLVHENIEAQDEVRLSERLAGLDEVDLYP